LKATLFSFSLDYLPTIKKGPVHWPTESIFITFAVKYQWSPSERPSEQWRRCTLLQPWISQKVIS